MSSSAHRLVQRCCARDALAWQQVWEIIERVASPRISQILRRRGFDVSLNMDVLQELFIYLRQDEFRRLRTFKGASDREFESFVLTITTRFTSRLSGSWSSAQIHESQLTEWSAVPDRQAATEPQISARLRELETKLSQGERQRLRILLRDVLQEGTEDRSYSDRTLRRWRRELRTKLEDISK